EVLRTLAALRAEGLTLLLIEHDTSAAEGADLLMLLREGRVVASGPPGPLLAGIAHFVEAGVRPPDVSRVFAALGLPDPPLDVDEAADRLRASGLVPRPCEDPRAGASGRPPFIVVRGLAHRHDRPR